VSERLEAARKTIEVVRPRRQEREHAVGAQAAQAERERLQRGRVGPVCVVDDDHDGPPILQFAEQRQQPRARGQRARLAGPVQDGGKLVRQRR
jgi:hypothetical protein